jgi:hypothetical protein
MIEWRAIGFEIMRQRIHAGGGGKLWRQADGQFRIEDCHLGHDGRMEDDLLLMRDRMRDDARTPHLRARAGRRRHRDDGGNDRSIGARPPVTDVFQLKDREVLRMHQRNHLARIEAGAAAEGDDAVVPSVLEGLAARQHILFRGIGAHIGEHLHLQPRLAQVGQGLGHHRHGGKPLVGDEQGPGNAIGLAVIRQFLDAAHAIFEGGRVIDVAVRNGHGFVLCRDVLSSARSRASVRDR